MHQKDMPPKNESGTSRLAGKLLSDYRSGRIDRRSFLRLAALAGLLPAMAPLARPGIARADEPKRGGTIVVAAEAEFEPLDPHMVIGSQSARITQNHLFESLVQINFGTDHSPPPFVPGLAQSWDISGDGKTYTFHLAQNVTFHDGTKFDASVVKWNMDRQWDQTPLGRANAPHFYDKVSAVANWRWTEAGLQEVEIVDPFTVRFHLAHPFNPLLRLMAQGDVGSTCMISPASYDKYGNEGIADHPVGTGMFRFKERIVGDRVTLVRNDDYWDKSRMPYLDGIVWRPINDPTSRENALRAGEVDFVFAPNPDSIPGLEADGFVVSKGVMPHIWVVCLNSTTKAFADKRVRQAVQYAIDREGMAHTLLSDLALPAESMISRASESYDQNARWYAYDPDKAKSLLAEAGAIGTKLVFATSTSGSGQILPVQMGEWIQQNLNAAGFQCDLKTYEWISYTNDFFSGMKPEWDMAQMSWGMTTDYWLTVFLHPNSAYNVSHVKIPELGELIDRGHQSPDRAASLAAYRQAADLAKEEAWWLPVVNDLAPVVMSARVKDFKHTADWQLGFFGNVWLEFLKRCDQVGRRFGAAHPHPSVVPLFLAERHGKKRAAGEAIWLS